MRPLIYWIVREKLLAVGRLPQGPIDEAQHTSGTLSGADAAERSRQRFARIKSAHHELLGGYVDVLAWTTHPSSGTRLALAPISIRKHLRRKLREAAAPYAYLRETAQDPTMRDWFEEANESLQRFSETLSYRSGWERVPRFAKAVGTITLGVAAVSGFKIADKPSREWAVTNSAGLKTVLLGVLAALAIGALIVVLVILFIVLPSHVAGFSAKREVFLGSASDFILVRRKPRYQGPRQGANIYELETNFFSALDFGKKEEDQLDVNLIRIVGVVFLGISLIYFITDHYLPFLIWLVIASIVLGLGGLLASVRKYK